MSTYHEAYNTILLIDSIKKV